jgi:hypothetical protein
MKIFASRASAASTRLAAPMRRTLSFSLQAPGRNARKARRRHVGRKIDDRFVFRNRLAERGPVEQIGDDRPRAS